METDILVVKSKKGDGEAFSMLIKLYEKDLYRVAFGIMKNDQDALDCIQETILKAYKKIKTLKEIKYFKTWLIKILINTCNTTIIKNKRIIPYANIEVRNSTSYYIDKIEMLDLIDCLGEELKLVILLYYYEDLAIKDIADILSTKEGTVKSRLARARTKLNELLINSERRKVNYGK